MADELKKGKVITVDRDFSIPGSMSPMGTRQPLRLFDPPLGLTQS
jgi:hypothetical protein